MTRFVLEVSPSGEVQEVSSELIERGDPNCAIGRRPVGLRAAGGVACTDALGRHFASAAHLEAASIKAFLRLREELELHGADVALRDAALVSALEEVLHTDVSTRLARRFGGDAPAARGGAAAPALPLRGGAGQRRGGLRARDVRRAGGAPPGAARAATRRCAGSWCASPRTRRGTPSCPGPSTAGRGSSCSAAEREALREAQREAVATLREEVAVPLDAALVTEAGMPAPEVAASLVDTLEQELWA